MVPDTAAAFDEAHPFDGWSTDLLIDEMLEMADRWSELDVTVAPDVLRAAAHRLDALYFGTGEDGSRTSLASVLDALRAGHESGQGATLSPAGCRLLLAPTVQRGLTVGAAAVGESQPVYPLSPELTAIRVRAANAFIAKESATFSARECDLIGDVFDALGKREADSGSAWVGVCQDGSAGGYWCELNRGHEGPHRAFVGCSDEIEWPRSVVPPSGGPETATPSQPATAPREESPDGDSVFCKFVATEPDDED